MLVLARKIGERIVIGVDPLITIEVVRVKGNRVQLGISAPKELRVLRGELHERIATGASPDKYSKLDCGNL